MGEERNSAAADNVGLVLRSLQAPRGQELCWEKDGTDGVWGELRVRVCPINPLPICDMDEMCACPYTELLPEKRIFPKTFHFPSFQE